MKNNLNTLINIYNAVMTMELKVNGQQQMALAQCWSALERVINNIQEELNMPVGMKEEEE